MKSWKCYILFFYVHEKENMHDIKKSTVEIIQKVKKEKKNLNDIIWTLGYNNA